MTVKLDQLSMTARTVLLSAGTSRQGARTYPRENESARQELLSAGLIGDKDGLTRAGTIVRERLVDRLMESL
jgi:hypothetical protein